MALSFPLFYTPRPYQRELHDMWKRKRIGVAVLPRQSGKDVSASMEQCEARLLTPKTLGAYIAPDRPSIKNILYGKSQNPKLLTIKMLCDGLDITLGEFFSTPEFDTLEQEIQ